MADIIQAAKWMEEGRKVRQRHWQSILEICRMTLVKRDKYGAIQDDNGCRHALHINELLADDWELAD